MFFQGRRLYIWYAERLKKHDNAVDGTFDDAINHRLKPPADRYHQDGPAVHPSSGLLTDVSNMDLYHKAVVIQSAFYAFVDEVQ